MPANQPNLLQVLRAELQFLESGGYRYGNGWRAALIFEDSPTCLNFQDAARPHPCTECPLMELVPPELRGEERPCRHIPLGEQGETLDLLYRTATQVEIEQAVREWLQAQIRRRDEEQGKTSLGPGALTVGPLPGEQEGADREAA